MSFEGFDQLLCANGHYWTKDALDYSTEPEKCSFCGEKVVWYNVVDLTNPSPDEDGNDITGYIELEVIVPAETHTCSCGHIHQVKPETYKIPETDGHRVNGFTNNPWK
jgi:hypothetical protein